MITLRISSPGKISMDISFETLYEAIAEGEYNVSLSEAVGVKGVTYVVISRE